MSAARANWRRLAPLVLAAWLAAVLPAGAQQPRVDQGRVALMDPPRAGVHYIDADGDGYGPGSPRGADADDADPRVNTPATVAEAYEDVADLLARRGYHPLRVFYVSPGGDDRMGRPDDPASPFATWGGVWRRLRPGDAVLFREGTYSGDYGIVADDLRGSEDRPILIAAYPGERAVFVTGRSGIKMANARWLIFDGLDFRAAAAGRGDGVRMHRCHDVVMRNLVVRDHYWGIFGMQDLRRVLIEGCVIHDNRVEHGIYLGSREEPNSDITIRRCVIYRNGRHGIQHNGRVTNLEVLDNVIHTNNLAGVSLIMGVSDSRIVGNRIFNNNKQGIVFYAYDDSRQTIAAHDQTGNVVADNVIWVGRFSWNGRESPLLFPGILFSDSTQAQQVRMSGNVIRGNVIVTQHGPCVQFNQPRLVDGNTVEGNVLHRFAGPAATFGVGEVGMTLEAFTDLSPACGDNCLSAPSFKDVSVQYYFCPGRFDFTPADPAEPARGADP